MFMATIFFYHSKKQNQNQTQEAKLEATKVSEQGCITSSFSKRVLMRREQSKNQMSKPSSSLAPKQQKI